MKTLSIKMSKALNLKNEIVSYLQEVGQRLSENSIVVGNTRDYDVVQSWANYQAATDSLVTLKTAITAANIKVQHLIYEKAELKGQVVVLKRMQTRNGAQTSSYATDAVVYEAHFKKPEVNKMVKVIEKRINAIQESLDSFNATEILEVTLAYFELAEAE